MKKISNNGRGNRKEQRKRRLTNNANTVRQEEEYRMIDGNYTHYPVAYCAYKHGVLTNNMMLRYSCVNRGCSALKSLKSVFPEFDDEMAV